MLRECHRVLLPAGRLAGYVIHTRDGLAADQMERAREMGPAHGVLGSPPRELLDRAGFSLTQMTDVTAEFRAMLIQILGERARRERELREEEGDELFEEVQERRTLTLQCVDEDLLIRTLWAAVRSG